MSTTVHPDRLRWLQQEISAWQADGLLDADAAHAIVARYVPSRRLTMGRLLLGLGAAFTGVGLIWLVAANLDELSPMSRFVLVVIVWLSALVGGEHLADRYGATSPRAHAVRLLAALAVGAVVFQAAQSLQVPAYEPRLLGLWGAAALLHAYVVGSRAPLVVGLPATLAWSVWETLDREPDLLTVVLSLALTGIVALALGAVHDRWIPAFASAWRYSGIGLLLTAAFAAAVPVDAGRPDAPDLRLWGLLTLAAIASVIGLVRGRRLARAELAAALAATAVAVVLALWDAGTDPARVGPDDWSHAVLAVTAYAALALGVAVVGVLRDHTAPTALAAVALVLFTTFQSFAVFAPIIDGAWLFVVLGLVLLGSGVLVDRARRRVIEQLSDTEVAR